MPLMFHTHVCQCSTQPPKTSDYGRKYSVELSLKLGHDIGDLMSV